MKKVHIITAILIILALLSTNVYADKTQVLTNKTYKENEQISIVDDEKISDADNSNINIKVSSLMKA